MVSDREAIEAQVGAAIAADARDQRGMTLEEHAGLLCLACESACRLEEARLRAGRPSAAPAPWPESTWEFLRKHAKAAQGSSFMENRCAYSR